MCSCDFDAPAFYSETIRRARKERRCRECRAVIAVGTSYVHISGKWDGSIDSSWMCLDCREIARAISDAGCCWSMQDVHSCARETLREHGYDLRDLPTSQVEGLGRLAGLLLRQGLEQSSGAASTGEGSG